MFSEITSLMFMPPSKSMHDFMKWNIGILATITKPKCLISSVNATNIWCTSTIFGYFNIILIFAALSTVMWRCVDHFDTSITFKLVELSLDLGLDVWTVWSIKAISDFEFVNWLIVIQIPFSNWIIQSLWIINFIVNVTVLVIEVMNMSIWNINPLLGEQFLLTSSISYVITGVCKVNVIEFIKYNIVPLLVIKTVIF